MENKPESFYTTFEDGKGDVNYSDKGFNEVIVNFLEIEMTCLKCRLFFPSKSKLHKYVKAGCMKKTLPFSST